jgi:hypothetical protein
MSTWSWMMVGVAAAAAAGGCVDAKGKFLEFDDRVGTTDASTIDRPPSQIYNINGTFLMSVEATFAQGKGNYVQFLATYTFTEQVNGTALVDASLQPLRVWTANPDREIANCPAGSNTACPPLVALQMAVDSNGTFSGRFNGTLPAEGNPLSGTAQPLDATMASGMISDDFVCGTATGEVAGLPLAGSTFAAIRVTDTTAENLPAPVIRCPEEQTIDAGVDATVDADVDATIDAGVDSAIGVDAAIDVDAANAEATATPSRDSQARATPRR